MKISERINILAIGIVATLLLFFIIQTAFARVLVDLFIGYLGNDMMLFLIIIGFESIVFFVSLAVGILVSEDIKKISVLKASLMAFILNLIFLMILSYISMFIMYPDIFSELQGPEVIIAFPTVMVYFSIYVLGQVFYLFVISIVSYYIFFTIFIGVFYQYKSKYKRR
ncbi:MAG: hypothetical protein GY853_15810 [PVC group bacterium]|nr:hypothetical protein [PVC group bacterium]